ncbi:MAG: ABC transporter ATP-binding protein/permease [Acutalibacter sp.]|nr:ABC transporter ATP-binding protein/permease [Acutalibacter sp.]
MDMNPLLRFYVDNKKYLPGILTIVGISLASGVLKMLAAAFWGKAVDFGLAGLVNDMLFAAALMAVFILLDGARTAVHYHIIGRITENMFVEVRARAFRKLTHGEPSVLGHHFRTGDVATRLNSDIDLLSTFSAGHVSNFSRLIFSGVFGLLACIFMSWQLSLAYVVILPLSLGLVSVISKPIQAQSKRSMDDAGEAMSMVADVITGSLTVKAFGAQKHFQQSFDQAAGELYQLAVRTEKLNRRMTGVKYLANVVQTMCLFLVGSWLVTSGRLSVGAFIAFVTMSNYITDAFSQSDYMFSTVRHVTACAQRYYEVIDIPDELPGLMGLPVDEDLACEAQGLSFSYDRGSRVLQGLDLRIRAGEKVAVVGPSGCGKSTLVRLLCRFYYPEEGSLRLFGLDSSDWKPDALRSRMAIVTQEPILFDGTVYENVAYGRPGLTRAQCQAVLQEVELWDLVSSWPDGMDHPIGEGGLSLSGGQKQRLCIARAMVKEAPLVLLDEATSALDLETEREVQKGLDKLLRGRAAVIIAHRLSTVRDVDRIYCMEEGRVVEEGAPAALLARKGKYYEMCRLQGLVEVEE